MLEFITVVVAEDNREYIYELLELVFAIAGKVNY